VAGNGAEALGDAPALLATNCFPPVEVTPPPADAPAELLAIAGAAVLVGAGDIAVCGTNYDEVTAAIVDSISRADSAANVEDAVFTVGDNWYPNGAQIYHDRCWKPSWGDTAKRIMRWLRPAVGNHDLDNGFGEAYYGAFGKNAGEKGKGYYSYDLGAWKVIVLNSEMMVNPAFSVDSRREQEEWLKKELAGNTKKCTVAYFHRPVQFRWTCRRPSDDRVLEHPLRRKRRPHHQWPRASLRALRAADARRSPRHREGNPQIIVGTGGLA
jgi:hypothetical protein